MKNIAKLTLLGLLTWIAPFLISFLFYDRSGTLSIDINLFKSIMIVVGGTTGALAIIFYFKKIESGFLKNGILAGIIWYMMNIVLDLLILIPMSKMTYPDYFAQIGLRYLMIPIMCFLSGYLIEFKIVKPNIIEK
jgi:hypothetical protein